MNESEHSTTSSGAAPDRFEGQSVASLNDQLRTLHGLVVAALVALLLLSFAFFVFLFRQISFVRKELDAANAIVQEYQTKREPLITNFVASLQSYARTHPDFTPILERYGIQPAVTQSLTPLASEKPKK